MTSFWSAWIIIITLVFLARDYLVVALEYDQLYPH